MWFISKVSKQTETWLSLTLLSINLFVSLIVLLSRTGSNLCFQTDHPTRFHMATGGETQPTQPVIEEHGPKVVNIALALRSGLRCNLNLNLSTFIKNTFNFQSYQYFPLRICQDIGRVTGTSLPMTLMNYVNGEINVMVSWIVNVYGRMKIGGANQITIYATLNAYIKAKPLLLVNRLKNVTNSEIALGVFFVAATIHLLLVQELVRVDPNVTPFFPSNHASQVAFLARDYSQHAINTYNSIMVARHAAIGRVQMKRDSVTVGESEKEQVKSFWIDSVTNYKYGDQSSKKADGTWTNGDPAMVEAKSWRARTEYEYHIDMALHNALNDPIGFVFTCNELEKWPVMPLANGH